MTIGIDCNVEVHDEEIILAVCGEVDLATINRFTEDLGVTTDLAHDLKRDLIVDLSRVAFIGALGLDAIVRAARRLKDVGASMVLRSPAPIVARALDVTATDTVGIVIDS